MDKLKSFLAWDVFHKATLSGCLDVIVVEQEDGTFKSTPFHVRLGRFKVSNPASKEVTLLVNGKQVPFKMKIDDYGVAYFEENRPRKYSEMKDNLPSSEDLGEQLECNFEDKINNNYILELLYRPPYNQSSQLPDQSESEDEDGPFNRSPLKNTSKDSKPVEEKKMEWVYGKMPRERQTKEHKKSVSEQQVTEPPLQETEKGEELLSPKNSNHVVEKSVENGSVALSEPNTAVQSANQEEGFIVKAIKYVMGKDSSNSTPSKSAIAAAAPEQKEQQASAAAASTEKSIASEKSKEEEQKKGKTHNKLEMTFKDEDIMGMSMSTLGNLDSVVIEKPVQVVPPLVESEIIETINTEVTSNTEKSVLEAPVEANFEIEKLKSTEKVAEWPLIDEKVTTAADTERATLPPPLIPPVSEEVPEILPFMNDIELSLCGDKINKTNYGDATEVFMKFKVSHEEFLKEPLAIMRDPKLRVKIGEDLYSWELANIMLLCKAAYGRDFPEESKHRYAEKPSKPSVFSKLFSFGSKKPETSTTSASTSATAVAAGAGAAAAVSAATAPKQPSDKKDASKNEKSDSQKESVHLPKQTFKDEELQKQEISGAIQKSLIQSITDNSKNEFRKLSDESNNASDTSARGSSGNINVKTLRPKSHILENLNLVHGRNEIRYIVTDGTQKATDRLDEKHSFCVRGSIYLLRRNAQIVISDIDGTITKSDLLGHLMPLMGLDWSHSGIAKLYTKIEENGYEILYLTARAIGESDQTRNFLTELNEKDSKLPMGPVLMSPDGLFPSFKREVIYKLPHIFKIHVLTDVKNLFEEDCPFYAGFGNRETDAEAYSQVGVQRGKIFLVNPLGELYNWLNTTYKKSYTELHEIIDDMFPPIHEKYEPVNEEYTNSNYWKIPIFDQYEDNDLESLLK